MSITRYFDPRTADEFNLRHGLLRKSPLIRNLAFKQQWRQWKLSAAAKSDLQAFRNDFEACFFETDGATWTALVQENRFRYVHHPEIGDSKLLFLMDALKDHLVQAHFETYKAEIWKKLDPEMGVEVHQRYLLHPRMGFWKKLFFRRWLQTDLVAIEVVHLEKVKAQLEIRFYPAKRNAQYANIFDLMAVLLKAG